MTETILIEKVCKVCNRVLKESKRSHALYCGKRCKNKAVTLRKDKKTKSIAEQFITDRFADQIKNSLEFYKWSLNKLMIQYESKKISLIQYAELHQELQKVAQEMYKNEMEIAIIKQCAEQSTSNASSYSDGYKKGWDDSKKEIMNNYLKL